VYILILAISFIFRIVNLGYSDFQGDEISAQNYLFGEESFLTFLFSRTVGPGQYVVTFLMNLFFKNARFVYFAIRLPFCVTGILVILSLYKLVRKNFGKRAALIAAFFTGFSGLLIAFSRIAQYQTFVMLTGILAITYFWKYLNEANEKHLTQTAFFCGIGFLFHYDALSFIIPIGLVLLIKKPIKHLLKFGLITFTIAGIFYAPYILLPYFRETFSYLVNDRIASSFKFDSIFYSLKLFSMYHSREFSFLFLGCGLLWLFNFQKKLNLFGKFLLLISFWLITNRILYEYRIEQLVVSSIAYFGIFLAFYLWRLKKSEVKLEHIITLWFFVGFFAYAIVFSMPLTHIYTFLVPLFILAATEIEKHYSKIWIKALFLIALISSTSFNYNAFISHKTEYPWKQKNYIFGKMPSNIVKGEEVKGIFGFPYNRNWKEISFAANEIKNVRDFDSYGSNEKYRIAKYYMQGFKFTGRSEAQIFIFVEDPQSLDTASKPPEKPVIESEKYSIYVFENH